MAFGKTGDVYTTPIVRLVSAGVPWLAEAAVASWSVEREMVASVVPGTLRSRNGLSVGAASASLVQDKQVTPWSPDAARLVSVEIPVALEAVEGGETYPLGAWVTAPASGSMTSRQVDVEMYEAQVVARGLPQAVKTLDWPPFTEGHPVDPCWLVGRLAAQAGFHATPPAIPDALLSLPLAGSLRPEPLPSRAREAYQASGEVAGWEVMPGDTKIGTANGSAVLADAAAGLEGTPISDRLASNQSIYITLDVVGTVYLLDFVQGWQVRVVNDYGTGTHAIAVCNTGDGTFVAEQPFTPGGSSAHPNRVQVELWRERAYDATGIPGDWNTTVARARSGPDAPWSGFSFDGNAQAPLAGGIEFVYLLGGFELADAGIYSPAPGKFAAAQFTTSAPSDLWLPTSAHLKPLGGNAGLPWVPAGMDAWTAIQDLCSAWLAAAIVGRDGVLRMLARDDLAGAAVPGVAVDIGAEWVDLPWSIDAGDRIDRLEVTFATPTIKQSDPGSSTEAPRAWTADAVVQVDPGETKVIVATLDGVAAVGIFRQFYTPLGAPDAWWSQSNFVLVFSNPEGTGSPVPNALFSAGAVQDSATTARIVVQNHASYPIYLVDGNGEPSLILHARTVANYETTQIIERGASAATAKNPLQVDLSPWVQRPDDAQAIADHLWSRLSGSQQWRASGVQCRLDWDHDLGRVLLVEHPETGLLSKALVTKVSYEGAAGEIAQTIDFVLLPWAYLDFEAAWDDVDPAATYADFATAQGPTRTYADMSIDSNWTGA